MSGYDSSVTAQFQLYFKPTSSRHDYAVELAQSILDRR